LWKEFRGIGTMDNKKIYFHKEIRRFLEDPTQRNVFRIDDATVGVTDGPLSKAILAARPMRDFERIVFKPIMNIPVPKATFSAVMRAVGQDARRVADSASETDVQLGGNWPDAGYTYLQKRLYSSDPWPIQTLTNRIVNKTGPFKPTLDALSSRLMERFAPIESSALARLVSEAPDARERRMAVTLYRRTARSMCTTVACLVTNALWLASASDAREKTRDCITETLRLMPPAWMYHRDASKEFAEVDDRIRETDDVLVIPLITQRDPQVWPDAETYDPDRWQGVSNPEDSDHYLPFGHSHDRCWARELVLTLAEHTLKQIAIGGFWTDSRQRSVKVPLKSLLCPTRVKVVPV
jgi:hypothetical protein